MNNTLPPIPRVQSEPVGEYRDISQEVDRMLDRIAYGRFGGKFPEALALAHVQLEGKNPKRFFVVHENCAKDFRFPSQVIINPAILSKSGDKQESEEACASFPFRGEKKMHRDKQIVVEYSIPKTTGLLRKKTKLEKITETVRGLKAFIFQHEIDHMNNITIYD